MIFVWLMLLLWFSQIYCIDKWTPELKPIPKDFEIGVSTAAPFIEGGRSADGATDSIWDTYMRKYGTAADNFVWQDTADSYHNVKRDITMLRELGVDFYKLSISWSRILPTGFPNKINGAAIEYYQYLFNQLNKYNIKPMVVMYNNDLPQRLQDLGGWANPESVRWFCDYAKVLLTYFNLHVAYWITINDPASCFKGYGGNYMPPALNMQGIADYICIKNMLLAHAKVYRYYKKNFMSTNEMAISVTLDAFENSQNIQNHDDSKALNQLREIAYDVILHPIFSADGDFPCSVKTRVKDLSQKEGYPRSRLPSFTKQEIKLLKGASDFLGMNHHNTWFVEVTETPTQQNRFPDICCIKFTHNITKHYPFGFYYTWFYLTKKYGNIPIFITELGWPSRAGIADDNRVFSMQEYMKTVMYAIHDSGNFKGVAFRSLMDGIEGTNGTNNRYGLFETDYKDPKKMCKPRASAIYLENTIASRLVKEDYQITKKFLHDSVSIPIAKINVLPKSSPSKE